MGIRDRAKGSAAAAAAASQSRIFSAAVAGEGGWDELSARYDAGETVDREYCRTVTLGRSSRDVHETWTGR